MKTLLYTLSFVLVSTWGVAQITTGHFGGNATLDNVVRANNSQTTNKWIKLAVLTLNRSYGPAGITVDFFAKNSNHGDSRQKLNVQFRNNHGTALESTHDISLVTFYGAQKTIKDVKVVHTSGTGVTNNKLSIWVQMGTSWLGSVPIEVRTYGAVTFETTNQPYFITLTIVGWVDLFVRPVYTQILDESLNYCVKSKGLIVHAYVYMTSHLHLIVSSQKEDINYITRDFKKYTSKKLIEAILEHPESRREWLLNKFAFEAKRINRNSKFKLWKDGFHPVILDTYKKWEQRVNYIHYNPVDAQFVYHERDWRNSSYAAYEEGNLEQTNIKVTPLW